MLRKMIDLLRRPRYRVIVIPHHSPKELRACVLNGEPVPRDCDIIVHRRSSIVGWDIDTTEQFSTVDDAINALRARHTKRQCLIKVQYLVRFPESTK